MLIPRVTHTQMYNHTSKGFQVILYLNSPSLKW